MRQQGHIKDWKDDKGFGFVMPLSAGEEPAFVHINSFLNRQRRPANGDLVSYDAVQDFQKRWQAQSIRYVDETVDASPAQLTAAVHTSNGSTWSALPLLRTLLVLLVLGIVGLVGYHFRAQLGLVEANASSQAQSPADAGPRRQAG